jgi:hypothetical protein
MNKIIILLALTGMLAACEEPIGASQNEDEMSLETAPASEVDGRDQARDQGRDQDQNTNHSGNG